MIDDRWSDDAEEMAGALGRVLSKHSGSEDVRAAEAGASTAALDEALAEFGLADLAGEPELVIRAARELGATLAPTAFVAKIPALMMLGRDDITDGVDRDLALAGPPLVALRADDGNVGLAATGPAVRSSGGDLVIRTQGLTATETTQVSSEDWRCWGWLASAAALVGAAEQIVTITVDYVSQRRQFGQPVGAFQGVAFPLADAATAVRGADLLLRKTTYLTRDASVPPQHFAAMTAHTARRAARQAASAAHQAMGGQGFTLEADTQLYSRRIRSWSSTLADPREALALMARTLANPQTRSQITDLWQFDEGFVLPRWAREAEELLAQPS